jgi:hypothetical protein
VNGKFRDGLAALCLGVVALLGGFVAAPVSGGLAGGLGFVAVVAALMCLWDIAFELMHAQ